MGFFSSLSKGWAFMKEAFAMARDDRTLLKPSVYQVMTSIIYWVVWVGAIIALDVDMESDLGKILGVVSLFGSFLIFYFFCGMTVNMVDVHIKGGTPSVSEGFRDARQNFLAIAFLALVSTIVEVIAKAVRRSAGGRNVAGVVASILASIIESLWSMVAFLLLPAIIIEDISLGQALKRVRAISKGNFMLIGIGEVGVRAVTSIIGFLVTLLIFGLAYVSIAVLGGDAGFILFIVLAGTVLSLFVAFATFIRMAYYTCLYIWASDVEAKGPGAEAPLPLARVVQRP